MRAGCCWELVRFRAGWVFGAVQVGEGGQSRSNTRLLLGWRFVAFRGPQSLVRRPAACAARALPRRTATTARATECHSWPAGAASMRSVGIRRTQQRTLSCTALHRRLLLLHASLARSLTRATHCSFPHVCGTLRPVPQPAALLCCADMPSLLRCPSCPSCITPALDTGFLPTRLHLHHACAAPQDELHKRYKHGSALQMMCWMNFWWVTVRKFLPSCAVSCSVRIAVCAAACSTFPLACAGPQDLARCCNRCWFQHPRRLSPCVVCRCGLYYIPILFLFGVGQDLIAFCLRNPEVRCFLLTSALTGLACTRAAAGSPPACVAALF